MMKDEISRVLTMVQEGKIDAAKAAELIDVLKEKQEPQVQKSSNYLDKTLKIRIVSKDKDNVTVNLPIKLVKAVLKVGYNLAANIPEAEKYANHLDIDLLIEAIENELDGQIVDIKSADGDTVAVFIE